MSKEELRKLIKDAEKALKTIETRRLTEAKKAAESAAKEYGFSLDELLGTPQKKAPRASRNTGTLLIRPRPGPEKAASRIGSMTPWKPEKQWKI